VTPGPRPLLCERTDDAFEGVGRQFGAIKYSSNVLDGDSVSAFSAACDKVGHLLDGRRLAGQYQRAHDDSVRQNTP
jgi:hypothetical protein